MEEVNLETNEIKLTLGDWLYNAGIVGFLNVLKHSGDESKYRLDGQNAYFNIEVLEGFEEKYFKYLIDTYEKTLAWSKVVEYKKLLEKISENNFENFNEDKLKTFNDCIADIKKYTTSNSHLSAYELISNKLDIVAITKDISTVKLKKGETVSEKIQEIKDNIEKVMQIIRFYEEDESKKYIAGKNVIYSIVNNAWEGVSFLNTLNDRKDKKTGEFINGIEIRDIYLNYKNYFPEETKKYLEEEKSKYKYNCFTCNSAIKNFDNELAFLNCSGFDTTRKPSHVWNFVNDIAICPICKLIYSCIPAGFSYVYSNGIYINENNNIEFALNVNSKLKYEILKDDHMNQNTTFKAMIVAMQESINSSVSYELSDVQVVKYEDEKYRFNILSKNILKVLKKSKDDLNKLLNAGFNEIKTYFRIYEEAVKKIMNNENLFLLIHKMLILELEQSKDKRFHIGHIKNLMNINYEYLKGVGAMNSNEKDILKTYSGAGFYLKKAYKDKSSENKLNGISYRLLNALKTNNQGMFMDTVLNCYLYTDKQIPSFFTDCLKEIELFKTIGYAFVSGLMDGEIKDEKTNGGNE